MPIGPRGERLPYPGEAGMGAGPGPDLPPMNPGGAPQMPPIEAVVARIQELQAELQQLVALAEQMGAGQGQPMPQQGNNMAMEYEASKGQPGLLA
jgi:hypothetical protein